jgi:hypothetical protein
VKRDKVLAEILAVRSSLGPALRFKLCWLGEYVGVHVYEILGDDHGSLGVHVSKETIISLVDGV